MSILKSVSFRTGFLGIVLFMTIVSFKGDKDALHKRIFNIMLDEVKDGIPGKKGVADKLTFKDGKMFSDFLFDKFGYKWMRYRINKDSIFTDSTDTEVRMLEVESSATNADNQTVMINFVSVEWDLDGTVRITKNDKIKKFYDMVGREKGGKPKKPKKKKENKIFEIVEPGEEPKTIQNRK